MDLAWHLGFAILLVSLVLRLTSHRGSMRGALLINSYHRLIEWVDRPSVLLRLGIAFVAAWAIFFSQVSSLDQVPPDYIDKGVYCLHALGHTLTMAMFRSLFPWLVAAQIAGVVLIALRIAPLVWVPVVVLPLFWGGLVLSCPLE
jgi:hypothetical protein